MTPLALLCLFCLCASPFDHSLEKLLIAFTALIFLTADFIGSFTKTINSDSETSPSPSVSSTAMHCLTCLSVSLFAAVGPQKGKQSHPGAGWSSMEQDPADRCCTHPMPSLVIAWSNSS